MKFDLTMPYDKDLKEEEKQEIDSFIDSIYEQCKDNSKEITQLAMEASFALNAGKNRANELCRQGFFKNLWGNIRGKNRKIRGEIDRDFAVSQRAGIKMIQKLAEHNKLTFEMIKNINLKLNCLVNEIDEELNQIYLQMNEFMKQVMDNFIEMSDKMNKLESKVNIHDLVIFIKHHDINGVKFTDLNINEKFLYFISEFFLKNKSLYIESDLMNLRYVMKEIGIESDDKISLLSIYDTLMSNSSIADKFFLTFDKEKLNDIEDFTIPILGNIKKIEKLENEEKYIIDSVIEMSVKDRKEVILNLLKNYSYNNLNMDLEKENSYFDLSISILGEMKNIIEYDNEKHYHKIPVSNILRDEFSKIIIQFIDMIDKFHNNQFGKAQMEVVILMIKDFYEHAPLNITGDEFSKIIIQYIDKIDKFDNNQFRKAQIEIVRLMMKDFYKYTPSNITGDEFSKIIIQCIDKIDKFHNNRFGKVQMEMVRSMMKDFYESPPLNITGDEFSKIIIQCIDKIDKFDNK